MASTRFPGKPLADLCGKPMLQWVVEAATRSGVAERVLVATPDQEIIDSCARFGAEAVLTSLDHPSGTDRIAEVSDTVLAEVYVNVQGDEPLIDPGTIAACAQALRDEAADMSSVFTDCPAEEVENPAVVKVVTDLAGFALAFSRSPLPYVRNPGHVEIKKHVGIYAYRREALRQFAHWEPTPLELTEGLEQLRFLEHGVRIRMARGQGSGLAVDTPEQAEQVRAVLSGKNG